MTTKSWVKGSFHRTAADMQMCIRLFQDYATKRNAHLPGDKVPNNVLATDDHQNVSFGWVRCHKAVMTAFQMLTFSSLPSISSATVSCSQTALPYSESSLAMGLQLRCFVYCMYLTCASVGCFIHCCYAFVLLYGDNKMLEVLMLLVVTYLPEHQHLWCLTTSCNKLTYTDLHNITFPICYKWTWAYSQVKISWW